MEAKNLINKKYKKDFQNHLLEQYKIYVKSADDVSSRRLISNNFYLTINSIIFGLVSYFSVMNRDRILILLSLVGIIISVSWYLNIRSYRKLNSAKFRVIHNIEEYLPIRPYTIEDYHINKNYKTTITEAYIPLAFMVLYLILLYVYG